MFYLSSILNPDEENCINAVCRLRDRLNVPITNIAIRKQLKEHQDYPSLLSISDALSHWKIDNISLNISKENIRKMPVPFLVRLKKEKKYFVTVVGSFNEQMIEVSDILSNHWKKLSWEVFEKEWTGTIMLVDPLEGAGENEYKKNKKKQALQRFAPLVTIGSVIFLWALSCTFKISEKGLQALSPILLLTLKLFGSYIGILLLWYDIDKYNPALQNICGNTKKINCSNILESSVAKIGGVLSWSEIGFLYFAAGFITLLCCRLSDTSLFLFAWLNLFTLPYTFFSVYYQWKVARQWCLLCVTIQAILVSEFIVGYLGGMHVLHSLDQISANDLLTYILVFSFTSLTWYLIKPLLLLTQSAKHTTLELVRLKHNPSIFEALLVRQKNIPNNPAGLGIILGNITAKNKIIKVCNPYCPPCAKSHVIIEELLVERPDLQVQVIFNITNESEDIRSAPVKHFLALAEQGVDS